MCSSAPALSRSSLIERALSERTSDIHLEPQDGEMYAYRRSFAPRAYGPLRIAEHRHLAPQDHGQHEHCRSYRRIFDIARLVAPTICVELTKTDEGCTLKKSEHCYAVWKKKRRCENCIS